MAALGIGALLASAAAHLLTAYAIFRSWRSWVCASLVLGGAVATVVVALFRASCPGGPAGCGLGQTPAGDWIDAVHGLSVGVYEIFVLAAMLALAIGALRRSSRWPRWLGLVSLAFAVGSVILIGQTDGDHLGMWQRLWLANNLAWLVVVAWTATMGDLALDDG